MFPCERSDSTMTVLSTKCHRYNLSAHNDLSCPGDRSDRVYNFSAGKTDIEERRQEVYGHVYMGGLEKSVKSVTAMVQIQPPYGLRPVTVLQKAVTVLSLPSPKSLCERASIQYKEVPMTFKIIYGTKVKLTDADRSNFSRGKFECVHLLQTLKGKPVAVSHCTDPEEDYWKVEYDYSCVVFATEQDALDFCKRRFCDLSGKRLYRRKADA